MSVPEIFRLRPKVGPGLAWLQASRSRHISNLKFTFNYAKQMTVDVRKMAEFGFQDEYKYRFE